jgi:hypothetical protein
MISIIDLYHNVLQIPADGMQLATDILRALPTPPNLISLYIDGKLLHPHDPIPLEVSRGITPIIAVPESSIDPACPLGLLASCQSNSVTRFSHIYFPMGPITRKFSSPSSSEVYSDSSGPSGEEVDFGFSDSDWDMGSAI